MNRYLCGAAACATAIALLLTSHPARAQEEKKSPEVDEEVEEGLYSCGKAKGPVAVSFKPDIELKDLITWAMGFTCKNFVYDAGVGGRTKKVTIIAPKKMSPREAWRVFLVAIQTVGLTVVPQGAVLRIVETQSAKTEPLPLFRKGGPANTQQLVRMVMRPEHIPVDDLRLALDALKSKDGQVTPLTKLGILVVTDYGSIITKMRALVREVDSPIVGERLYMIRVRHADATELVAKLNDLLGTQQNTAAASGRSGSSGSSARRSRRDRRRTPEVATPEESDEIEAAVPSKMIADERTNSIIVLASEPAYLRVRSLIKRLDVAIGVEGEGRIHVHYLENGDAEEMANTLSAAISGISQPSSGNPSSRGRVNRQPVRPPTPGGGGESAPAFEGQVRVSHDKPTNSLVIVASIKDYLALRSIIEKLDIPRRQVFIEAVIFEVVTDSSRDLGTSFHGGVPLDDGSLGLFGLQHSNLQSINPASLAGATGLIGGILGPLLEESEQLLGVSIPEFGVLFQALATSNNVNILSSPHILTTNNEEAEISVGENIPYQSSFSNFGAGQGGAGGGFAFPVQSVQRQDVALTLKITPHVNASEMVRLQIDQEISDIASPNFEGLGPSWSKRSIKTTVVVRDQQSIVIGGLMRDRSSYTETKIPLLGDIPLLGYLFKYTQKGKTKTNLLVLLTPYIINDQLDLDEIVRRKVQQRNEFIRSFASFAKMDIETEIDYRRKRGLVEEINRTVASIDRDIEKLRDANLKRDEFQDGMIEYDIEGGDQPGGDEPPAEAPTPVPATPAPASEPSSQSGSGADDGQKAANRGEDDAAAENAAAGNKPGTSGKKPGKSASKPGSQRGKVSKAAGKTPAKASLAAKTGEAR